MRKRVIFCVKIATAILLALVFALFSASCEKKERIRVSEIPIETLEESLSVGNYKGLVIELKGKSREDAIIDRIMMDSYVKRYPDGATDYYADQIKKQYKYYADEAGMAYEEMLAELEKIVSQLENGEATLEEALEMYKKGTLLASKCGELLDNAEKQIKILVNGTNGEMTENDFAGNEI